MIINLSKSPVKVGVPNVREAHCRTGGGIGMVRSAS
jgi:hypothetical protein